VTRYAEFCKSTVSDEFSLRGMSIVLDCAHGATYQVAPKVFRELGAEVTTIGTEPVVSVLCVVWQPAESTVMAAKHAAEANRRAERNRIKRISSPRELPRRMSSNLLTLTRG